MRDTALLAVAVLAVALLSGAGGIRRDLAHPPLGDIARPLQAQPSWMRRSAESNLPETVSPQARTVIAYCGQCHVPPPPALRTADEWRWMIVRMDARATDVERIGLHTVRNDELLDIARYYERHARR